MFSQQFRIARQPEALARLLIGRCSNEPVLQACTTAELLQVFSGLSPMAGDLYRDVNVGFI